MVWSYTFLIKVSRLLFTVMCLGTAESRENFFFVLRKKHVKRFMAVLCGFVCLFLFNTLVFL